MASLTITSPANGAILSGSIKVTVNYKGPGFRKIDLYIDNVFAQSSTLATASFTVNTTALADGTHALKAVVTYDQKGTSTIATQVIVTYANTTGGTSPPPPTPAPPIQGYTLVWSDEFDTLDANLTTNLNDTKKWQNAWYRTAPPAGSITVSNSVLHMQSKRSDGYPYLELCTRRLTKAGSTAFTRGYFETRMQFTNGPGIWCSFWMSGLDHIFDISQYNPELDVMELVGERDVNGVPEDATNWYSGTLHKNTGGGNDSAHPPWGTTPDLTNGGSAWQNTGSSLAGAWHTIGALWDTQNVSWYVDNTLMHSWPVYTTTSIPMILYLALYIDHGESGIAGNLIDHGRTTPDTLDFQVDWVRVWQLI